MCLFDLSIQNHNLPKTATQNQLHEMQNYEQIGFLKNLN